MYKNIRVMVCGFRARKYITSHSHKYTLKANKPKVLLLSNKKIKICSRQTKIMRINDILFESILQNGTQINIYIARCCDYLSL